MAKRGGAAAPEPPEAPAAEAGWRDVHVRARDGLTLHARDYGSDRQSLPVVCLPGLTRNARDFHELAEALSAHRTRPRRVLALDFRGRGGSGWDRDWKNYSPMVEAGDVLDMLAAARIGEACFVGTSRGGLVAMLLSALRPTAIRAVVLNDVGPEIDGRGLLRIKNVLSATGAPGSWSEAAAMLRRASEAQFPEIDDAGWNVYARKTYDDRDGRPVRAFDPKIIRTLQSVDYNQPLPTLWPQFDGLANVPVMVLRAVSSDILSAETLERMMERRPDLDVMIVDNAGHAPMLATTAEIDRIAGFVAAAEDRKA